MWCTHRISEGQGKHHSRYILESGTTKTRVTRLWHQSEQHRKDFSTSHHTDCTSKPRKTTGDTWGNIQRSSTEALSQGSPCRVAQDNQRLSPQYTVILILQGWNLMQRWYLVQRGRTDHAPVWEKFNPQGVTHGTLCNLQNESQGQRDSLLARNQWGHQSHISEMWHLCKVCKDSAKGDAAVCWNTSIWIGTTWFRHFLIEKHTLSSNNWLFQPVPHCQKTAESPLTDCNQTSQENLNKDSCA